MQQFLYPTKFPFSAAFLALSYSMWNYSDQGLNLCPLYWEGRFLFIGSPGKSTTLFIFLATPHACGIVVTPTRDWTHTPCIGRWNFNHWTTREVPALIFKILSIPTSTRHCTLYQNYPRLFFSVPSIWPHSQAPRPDTFWTSFFIFWPCLKACRILVPWPGIKTMPPALGAWSLNHWTTREVPIFIYDYNLSCSCCHWSLVLKLLKKAYNN